MTEESWTNVLGVNVTVGSVDSSYRRIRDWIKNNESHYVTITGAHGVIECQRDDTLRGIHNRAGMVTCDGMPLVWMSRFQGRRNAQRVYGPDLMRHVLRQTRDGSVRHFLYGASEETLEALKKSIARDYPGAEIVGAYSPPFRAVGALEKEEVIGRINAVKPDIIWVGLSTPKQEYWMANHIHQLDANALVGVGAAFDFLAGRKSQAPRFMQKNGLEWAYRLATEPGRLAGRYLDIVPRFLFLGGLQLMGLRKWRIPDRRLPHEPMATRTAIVHEN